MLFLKTSYYHRSEVNKYEKILLTRSHQRELELVNMRQTIYMVSMLQICPRSCLPLLLKVRWRHDWTTCRQPLPHWSKRPHRPKRNVVTPNRSARLPRVDATIARLNERGVATKRRHPTRRDRILALMNTVCGPPPTKRTSAYLPNLRRKAGQSPDKAQSNVSPIVLGQLPL